MIIKCKSEQVFSERYKYQLRTGTHQFFPVKARHGEVLIIHKMSIYNSSKLRIKIQYKLKKHRGVIHRWNYGINLDSGVVRRWGINVYLEPNDEAGIELNTTHDNQTFELCVQGLRLRDSEY